MGARLLPLAVVLLIGCHASGTTSHDMAQHIPDMVRGADMAFVAAKHPLRPQIPKGSGAVLAHPDLVTITWPGDSSASTFVAFDAWMVTSSYFTDSLGQYGISAGTAGTTYTAPAAAPPMLTDDDLRKLVTDGIAGGSLPAASADRLYILYVPSGTKIDSGAGLSCDAFSGYHNFITDPAGGPPVVYAVVATCPALAGLTVLQTTTVTASHEIAEAVTDPQGKTWTLPTTDPAAQYGGEVADLCDGIFITAGGYEITTLWSNAAAAADQRPCVPAPAGPAFGIVPTPTTLSLSAGQTGHIALLFYSTGALPPLTLLAAPLGDLDVTPFMSTVSNGDTVQVTVTLHANAAVGSRQSVDVQMIASDYQVVMQVPVTVQ